MFVGKGGAGMLHLQRRARLNSGGICAVGPKEEITVLEGWGPPGKEEA